MTEGIPLEDLEDAVEGHLSEGVTLVVRQVAPARKTVPSQVQVRVYAEGVSYFLENTHAGAR